MHNPIQGGPTIGKDWVMEPLQSSSELALRAFISHELPKTTDKIVNDILSGKSVKESVNKHYFVS